MIYLIYLILAIAVVLLSVKAAKYVDLIEKTTDLSGAFIGGVLLSAVTSLPELLTSISATVWLDNPGLSLGNILGSNLFNISILAMLILFGAKTFKNSFISKSHTVTSIFIFIIYGVVLLNMFNILNFDILTVSFTSVLILVLYIFGVKSMANDDSSDDAEEEAATTVDITLNQIIFRFILTSIGLVLASVLITKVTDIISVKLNLGTSLAGALFLGIATSLPEVTSCISLIKIGNFNIAIGNIVGSNIFNFLVLFIADVLYIGNGLYNFTEGQTQNLVIFGTLSTLLMLIILKSKDKVKNNLVAIISSLGIIASYILFLTL